MLPALFAAAVALSPAQALTLEDAQAILQIEAQRLPALALQDFVEHDDAATRTRAARALGRLRTAAALAPLRRLVEDPDAAVRAEAAWALGLTPGGERTLLARLDVEADADVVLFVLRGLGGQGSAEALPALTTALRTRSERPHPPAVAEAAALALGRMAARGAYDTSDSGVVDALLDQRQRRSGAVRRAAAFALARIRPVGANHQQRATLVDWAAAEPRAEAQAYLVRAASSLPPGEDLHALLASTLDDPDPAVRIATARASAPAGWPGVVALLLDANPHVRREAMAALPELAEVDAAALLTPIIEAGATLEAAEAARATGDPRLLDAAAAVGALARAGLLDQPRAFTEPSRPTAIRVAALDALDAPAVLRRLAAEDGEPRVRTAAAGRLFARDDVSPLHARALLEAFDGAVAAMAAHWLAEHPDREAEGALLNLLEESDDADVLAMSLEALEALYAGPYPKVRRPETPLQPFLAPLHGHRARAVREAAGALAGALDLDAPPAWHALVTAPLDELADVSSARILTTQGEVVVELLPHEAPLTVHNFVQLAEQRWFDNQRVHRVVPDFVVQTGDPRGDGNGGPGYSIPDEPSPLTYTAGTLGMALSGPDTGGSQWFVTLSDQPHLDDTYPIFGRVLRGQRVLEALTTTDRIRRVRIERIERTAGVTPRGG